MPIGTCRKCGELVVWNAHEIEAHLARCPKRPTVIPPADGTERGEAS